MPGLGSLLIPAARLVQLRRIHVVRQQDPQVVHGAGVPGLGRLLEPAARLVQLRRIHPASQQEPQVVHGVDQPSLGRLMGGVDGGGDVVSLDCDDADGEGVVGVSAG